MNVLFLSGIRKYCDYGFCGKIDLYMAQAINAYTP
jgi:hypothetical protein